MHGRSLREVALAVAPVAVVLACSCSTSTANGGGGSGCTFAGTYTLSLQFNAMASSNTCTGQGGGSVTLTVTATGDGGEGVSSLTGGPDAMEQVDGGAGLISFGSHCLWNVVPGTSCFMRALCDLDAKAPAMACTDLTAQTCVPATVGFTVDAQGHVSGGASLGNVCQYTVTGTRAQ